MEEVKEFILTSEGYDYLKKGHIKRMIREIAKRQWTTYNLTPEIRGYSPDVESILSIYGFKSIEKKEVVPSKDNICYLHNSIDNLIESGEDLENIIKKMQELLLKREKQVNENNQRKEDMRLSIKTFPAIEEHHFLPPEDSANVLRDGYSMPTGMATELKRKLFENHHKKKKESGG